MITGGLIFACFVFVVMLIIFVTWIKDLYGTIKHKAYCHDEVIKNLESSNKEIRKLRDENEDLRKGITRIVGKYGKSFKLGDKWCREVVLKNEFNNEHLCRTFPGYYTRNHDVVLILQDEEKQSKTLAKIKN